MEPLAELHALHSGNAEQGRRQTALHPVKHGISQSGGQADGGTFNGAAHAVQGFFGGQNGGLHGLPGVVVQNGEGLRRQGVKELLCGMRGKEHVLGVTHGGQMRPYVDAPAGQNLLGDSPGDAQRGCQAAGEVAAAPHVGAAIPLDQGGVVRMAGPGLVPQLRVVRRVLAAVPDDGAQRRAAGSAVFQAGEELRHVGLFSGGGEGARSRLPPVQKPLELLRIDLLSGGEPIDLNPDGLSVGLAEDADAQDFSELRGHGRHLPGFHSPARSRDRISSPPRLPG